MGSGRSGVSRLAAFLRGINLGGRRVTNDRLREPFEALGLEGVATYRASGNVIFDDPGIAAAELESEDDRFLALGTELVWLRRGRLSDSPIETRHLEAALGGPDHTMRTLGTVERIVDKFGS